MYERMCNPQKKYQNITIEFPGNPRGKKCKIPIVRSPNLQYLQWNLHLKIIILHSNTRISRNPKGKKCKIPIVRSSKPALFAVEPGPQYHQLTFSKVKVPNTTVRKT
jgi:hypothetical protein